MSVKDFDWKKISGHLAILSISFIAVGGLLTSFYFYRKYKATQQLFRDTNVAGQIDVQNLVEKVGKLIKLPEGELPTVATVSDLERLKQQEFFTKAKVGDKVLLYPQAKKAFLYDPVDNVILEVGPLVIPTATLAVSQSTESGTITIDREEKVTGTESTRSPTQKPSPSITL